MVPAKFFQQLLRNLDDPQPNAIRNQHHWRAPILCSSARKVTYRLFDLDILKVALEKQNTVTLQEQVHWNGDTQVTDYPSEMDPREALACEQQMYFRSSLRKITSAISSCEAISVTSILFFLTRPMKLSDRKMLLITRAKSRGPPTASEGA